jgi:hypothetical protein
MAAEAEEIGTPFTYFAGTAVQILTQVLQALRAVF